LLDPDDVAAGHVSGSAGPEWKGGADTPADSSADPVIAEVVRAWVGNMPEHGCLLPAAELITHLAGCPACQVAVAVATMSGREVSEQAVAVPGKRATLVPTR
jgi:hypothetical protein